MAAPAAEFTRPAPEATLGAVAGHLRERNFAALIVETSEDAKTAALELIPPGAEVHTGKSKTLEDTGILAELTESGRYDVLRRRLFAMDRATQAREIRKLGAAPDVMLGSVQALTHAGQLVAASASGSQLGPYASGAGTLILVVGSQKIVPDLDAALRRITDHVQPYEDATLHAQMGVHTALCRILILERDFRPGRTTIILVREPAGV